MIDEFMLSPDYEPETRSLVGRILKEGDSFLVAGAHQGMYASYAASLVGPEGTVYAFEPQKENYAILEEAVKDFGNVKTYNCALGDRVRAGALLYINKDNSGGSALWDVSQHPCNLKTKADPSTELIHVTTIDTVLDDVPLKLILLDAEGSEHAILKGGINTIVDNDVPYIICEINNHAMRQCRTNQISLRSFMAMYGYKCFVITADGLKEPDPQKVTSLRDEEGTEYIFNVLFSRKGKI